MLLGEGYTSGTPITDDYMVSLIVYLQFANRISRGHALNANVSKRLLN